jgi:N-acetylneuraminic acid mutarotase
LAVLRKLIIITLSLGTLITSCSFQRAWVRKADLPTGRSFLTTTVLDGKIYAMGGIRGKPEGYAGSARVEVYDPASNSWTKKADMLAGRGGLASVVVDGKIYAIGGAPDTTLPPVATVEVYDPAANTWIRTADMPEARDGVTAGQVNGKIFVIGGAGYNPVTFERIALPTVEEFDPALGIWRKKTDMPTPRYALSSCVIDGKVYALGGLMLTFAMATPAMATAAVEAYDPAADTWTKRANMPEARWGAAAVALDGKIDVFGGTNSDTGPATSTVFEYDPLLDAWTTRPDMPFKKQVMSASALNGKVYIIGGSVNSFPYDPLDRWVWEYRP